MNAAYGNPGEKTVLTDAQTGRTAWRITNSEREDKHTYYDLCPWSPDGKRIVFSSADPADLTVPQINIMTTQKGKVCLLDTTTYSRTELVHDTFFQTHNGTPSVWSPDGRSIYYQKSEGVVGVFDVEKGRIKREMKGPLWVAVWWLSPDGKSFVIHSNDSSTLEGRGMYTMDEDGSHVKLVASIEELYGMSPYREDFALDSVNAGIGKWSPDGNYVMFLMWVTEAGNARYISPAGVQPSLFVSTRDGSRKWWVGYTGHHQSFTPDSKRIIWGGWKYVSPECRPGAPDGNARNRDPRIFMANIDGSDTHIVVEKPFAGHPTMDPTCRWIVTSDEGGVVLVDVAEQTVEQLAVFKPRFSQKHSGTHPHCVWNRDGSQILYNSAETGHSQLYIIPVDL